MGRKVFFISLVIALVLPLMIWAQADSTKKVTTEKQIPGGVMPDKKVESKPDMPAADISAEAEVCTGVEDHMPVGTGTTFSSDVEQLYFWTRIVGVPDTINVRHVWVYNGEELATVMLPVRSPNWRTYSSKKLLPSWKGKWEARLVGPDGTVMASVPFTVE